MSYSSFHLLLQGKPTFKVMMLYLPNTLGFLASTFINTPIVLSLQCTYEAGRADLIHPGGSMRELRPGSSGPLLYTPLSAWPPKQWHIEISFSLFDTGCLGTRMDHTIPQMSARQSVATCSQPGVRVRGPGWLRGAGSPTQHTETHPMLHPSLQRAPLNRGTHA